MPTLTAPRSFRLGQTQMQAMQFTGGEESARAVIDWAMEVGRHNSIQAIHSRPGEKLGGETICFEDGRTREIFHIEVGEFLVFDDVLGLHHAEDGYFHHPGTYEVTEDDALA